MKWSRSYLASIEGGSFDFQETIVFDPDTFRNQERLRDLRDVSVSGTGRYDTRRERLYVDLTVTGVMTVPCSITLEDVDRPFHITDSEIFAFNSTDDEDVYKVKGEYIELLPLVYQLIMMDIPWKIHKADLQDYPKGKGWEVINEAEVKERQTTVDPRLAKILEFKPDDD